MMTRQRSWYFMPNTVCRLQVQMQLKPSEHARNIGVIFDPHVSLDRQIASVCKSAFYSIRAISKFGHC